MYNVIGSKSYGGGSVSAWPYLLKRAPQQAGSLQQGGCILLISCPIGVFDIGLIEVWMRKACYIYALVSAPLDVYLQRTHRQNGTVFFPGNQEGGNQVTAGAPSFLPALSTRRAPGLESSLPYGVRVLGSRALIEGLRARFHERWIVC